MTAFIFQTVLDGHKLCGTERGYGKGGINYCNQRCPSERCSWHLVVLQVPYQDLPFLFFGEEQAMLARMWMAGFDLYTPPRSVVWHLWSRAYRPTFHSCVPQVMHTWHPGIY